MEPAPAPEWEPLTLLLLVLGMVIQAMEATLTERLNLATMPSKWAMVSKWVRTLELPHISLNLSHIHFLLIPSTLPNDIMESLTF